MEQNRMLKHVYILPIFIFLALIMDGIIMNVFSSHLISNQYVLTPRLVLFVLVIFTFFFPKQPLFLYAVLFGLIYDSFYSGILGLYAAGFGTIIYLLKKIHKYVVPSAVMLIIIYILALTSLEVFIFLIYLFLGHAEITFQLFVVTKLGPTLLLNIVLFIMLYYPFYKLSQWMYN